jgi:hypothetical protein
MAWKKESVIVLVKATPNWSTTSRRYTICTAGVNKDGEWRRLYPMFWQTIKNQDIKVWDEISFEASTPEKDSRPESRKIRNESVKNLGCAIEDREERRGFLTELTDSCIPDAAKERKTLALVKPILFGFTIDKREELVNQATLYGGIFKERPYDDVGIYYEFKCGEKGCSICREVGKFHKMECFDFGANHLYRRYEDEKEAREKVRDMCFVRMKTDFDCWFAMGTHSSYPFHSWMIVGLLWMKKKPNSVA